MTINFYISLIEWTTKTNGSQPKAKPKTRNMIKPAKPTKLNDRIQLLQFLFSSSWEKKTSTGCQIDSVFINIKRD